MYALTDTPNGTPTNQSTCKECGKCFGKYFYAHAQNVYVTEPCTERLMHIGLTI